MRGKETPSETPESGQLGDVELRQNAVRLLKEFREDRFYAFTCPAFVKADPDGSALYKRIIKGKEKKYKKSASELRRDMVINAEFVKNETVELMVLRVFRHKDDSRKTELVEEVSLGSGQRASLIQYRKGTPTKINIDNKNTWGTIASAEGILRELTRKPQRRTLQQAQGK